MSRSQTYRWAVFAVLAAIVVFGTTVTLHAHDRCEEIADACVFCQTGSQTPAVETDSVISKRIPLKDFGRFTLCDVSSWPAPRFVIALQRAPPQV